MSPRTFTGPCLRTSGGGDRATLQNRRGVPILQGCGLRYHINLANSA